MTMATDVRLDVSGTCCPVPIIQMAKAVQQMAPGQTLEIIGNDPLFEISIRDFCQARGHVLLSVAPGDGGNVYMTLRIGG
jgi:tRNA 2-thiouridine synthesizing protein A